MVCCGFISEALILLLLPCTMSRLRPNQVISCPVLNLLALSVTAIFLVRGVSQIALVCFQVHGISV